VEITKFIHLQQMVVFQFLNTPPVSPPQGNDGGGGNIQWKVEVVEELWTEWRSNCSRWTWFRSRWFSTGGAGVTNSSIMVQHSIIAGGGGGGR
jgi:hypothetical protein